MSALGKGSEALEYVERARGHLYSFHQLMGRADILFEEAAHALIDAGHRDDGEHVLDTVVGRNVLQGRWTFQIVEEFDDDYYDVVRTEVRGLEARHVGGRRHVYESQMKDERRTAGRAGHERRPADGGGGNDGEAGQGG